jgi:hypothetical protein
VLSPCTGYKRLRLNDAKHLVLTRTIRRGTFTSVKDLIAAIETYIDAWNERCQPFTWTKTADEILTTATGRKRSSFTRH